MDSRRAGPAIAVLLLVAGCKDPAPSPGPKATATALDSGVPGDRLLLPLDDRLLQLGGEVDVSNSYWTTVMLTTSWDETLKSRCAGVMLSPQVVLTAGHCMCRPHPGAPPMDEKKSVIDALSCAETSTLRTVTYHPPKQGVDDFGSQVAVFRGRVLPHPELRVALDARGEVLSSHADLALLLLDESVPGSLPPVRWATAEAQPGEPLIVVGYGYDELSESHDGDRRASRNSVIRGPTPQDDRLTLEQPGRHLYKGDSGGPCLRPGRQGPELIGISSRHLGAGATCTSLHPYRDWLRAHLP